MSNKRFEPGTNSRSCCEIALCDRVTHNFLLDFDDDFCTSFPNVSRYHPQHPFSGLPKLNPNDFTIRSIVILLITSHITGTTQCGVRYPTTLEEYIYGAVVVLLGFVIPLCILGYMYFKIFHSVKRHTRRLSRVSLSGPNGKAPIRVHRQVAVTVFIMLIFFVVCWTPFYLYVLIVMTTEKAMRQSFHLQFLGRVGYWCAFLNSAVNPYIYGFRNPQFRKEFQLVLCWLCRPCVPAFARSKSCSFLRGSKGSSSGDCGYYWQGRSPSLIPDRGCEKVGFVFGYESYDNINEPELLRFEFPALDTRRYNNAKSGEDCGTKENNIVIEETYL